MASRVTRPMTLALMSTESLGWILPEAETIASRLRRPSVSTSTSGASERWKYRLA